MTLRFHSIVGGVLLSVFSFIAIIPAHAQTAGQLSRDLDRLERQVKALQRKVFDGKDAYFGQDGAQTSGTSQSQAAILVRLDTLEETVRSLTGQIEELRFQQNESNTKLNEFIAQANYRLSALDGAGGDMVDAGSGVSGNGMTPSGQQDSFTQAFKSPTGVADSNAEGQAQIGQTLAPPSAPAGPEDALVPQQAAIQVGPKERFDEAFQLARLDRFDDAEQAFLMFIADYPEHELASNAQYWLGRVYTAKRQTPQAAEAFLDGYRRYPDGNKAPENLLAFASTLRMMQKPKEACTALNMLKSKIAENTYPDVNERVLQGIDSESSVLACS